MTKLKLGAIADDKPVKLTVTLPAALHRLVAYAELLAAKPVSPSILPNSLRRCWRDSSPAIGARKARGADRNPNPKPFDLRPRALRRPRAREN